MRSNFKQFWFWMAWGVFVTYSASATVSTLACTQVQQMVDRQTQEDVEKACQRAVNGLKADKAAGIPCTVARARAQAAEPHCPLQFTCPADDAGTDAPDGATE